MSNVEQSSYYDQVWETLKELPEKLRAKGIPDHEHIPALADYLMIATLVIASSDGLSEYAANTILERQKNLLNCWLNGEPPFNEGFSGLDQKRH